MALDAELQIVSSQVVDVSENAEQLSTSVVTDKLNLGRRGFSRDQTFVVAIEAVVAAAAGANVVPVQFVLQASLDSGTVWFDVATISLVNAAALAKLGVWSAPIGMRDFRDEVRATDDLEVRVAVRYTNNGETDDFTYSAYLGGPNPYPSTDE